MEISYSIHGPGDEKGVRTPKLSFASSSERIGISTEGTRRSGISPYGKCDPREPQAGVSTSASFSTRPVTATVPTHGARRVDVVALGSPHVQALLPRPGAVGQISELFLLLWRKFCSRRQLHDEEAQAHDVVVEEEQRFPIRVGNNPC
jgi:hypothetical protein